MSNKYVLFSFPDTYFEALQPLFEIDPFVLRLFVLITDIKKLSSLFEKAPNSILIMKLANDCFYVAKVSNMCT